MSEPNPVARVVGAPDAPAAPAATSSPSRPAAGGLAGLSRNQTYAGAAVLVAAFAALSAWRGKKTDDDTGVTYEIDTSLTDVTSELEQINDRLDQWQDTPRPATPAPITKPTPPTAPKPAPKPSPPRDYVRYIVKQGDTLAKVAKAYRTTAANLYAWNKAVIDQAAAAHNRRTHGTSTVIWPGTVLTIKINLPGQRGVKLGF